MITDKAITIIVRLYCASVPVRAYGLSTHTVESKSMVRYLYYVLHRTMGILYSVCAGWDIKKRNCKDIQNFRCLVYFK